LEFRGRAEREREREIVVRKVYRRRGVSVR